MDLLRPLMPSAVSHPRFSGAVARRALGRPGDEPEVNLISCGPGSMTEDHLHPGGQVLVAVAGEVLVVGEDGAELRLGPGDQLVTAPEESHRHGAAAGSEAMFVAVTWGGTTWANP